MISLLYRLLLLRKIQKLQFIKLHKYTYYFLFKGYSNG